MSDPTESEWRQDRIRLTLPNDIAHVGVARNAVRAAAQAYGYSTEELDHWELVIEEAVNNVIRFAYDPGERASFDVDCLDGANGLTVRIRDRGRPFDPRRIQPIAFGGDPKTIPERGLGWHLMQRLMDVVTVESLGREGKQLTLFKAAPRQFEMAEPPVPAPPRSEPLAPGQEAVCRRATADDAAEVIRLFYDCYRYSYFNEQVYSPEALAEMITRGQIDSFVAELPDGRLVAHLALLYYPDRPNEIEYGMAATDPAYRGRGVLSSMLGLATEQALRSGKKVRFGGCVTTHVASQKSCLRLGIAECGLMLGAVPPENFSGFSPKEQGRGTIMFFAGLLQDRPAPALVLPPVHADFIVRLYENCRIPFARGGAGAVTTDHTDITVSVRPKLGTVRATVQRIGGDLTERIKAMMHGARQSRAEVGQLFLPLTDPALPQAVAALEHLGWFVTGMLPEGGMAGDVLLMHWLNGWAMEYDTIEMASDAGRQLLNEVRARDPEWR
jgi:serine/threonine-protein kinase RsbW